MKSLRPVACLTAALLCSGCVLVDNRTFLPEPGGAPRESLTAPAGYVATDRMIDLPGLGTVHAVRLDNPASEAVLIYSGGRAHFVGNQTGRAGVLAAATGADIILYDYPGRGGTSLPATIDAAISSGPAMVAAMREIGWIGSGPVVAYGYDYGGAQAAAMARGGGFAGLVLEGSVPDIEAVRANRLPGLARPMVMVRPDVLRFDYFDYVLAARAPVLLIASWGDRRVREENVAEFAEAIRTRGGEATLVTVPGRRGEALNQSRAVDAVRAFFKAYAVTPAPAPAQ